MTVHCRPVLVGVDGSPSSAGALRAGLAEALRLGEPLRLVHVVPDLFPLTPVDPLTSRSLTDAGADLLGKAADAASAQAPDVQVETDLRHGGTASELAAAGVRAAALYVGRDDRPAVERVLLGNTAAGTAARAACPVVSVPADWDPGVPRGEVVVAVKSPAHSSELLAEAFAAADALGDRLVVVHAWKLPSAYDDIIVTRVESDELRQRSTAELERLMHEWRTSYPDVDVEVRIVHDHPAHALVEASRAADLLVLVRHAHGFPHGLLGGTGRTVLRQADCPVRVVPPGTVTAVPGLVLERGGELAK